MDCSTSHLPDGYTIRPACRDDFRAVADLMNLCSVELSGRGMISQEDVEKDHTLPAFDLELDTRVVFAPDGALVACQQVWTIVDPPVHPFVWGRVHPEHRGRGLGTHLLDWSVDRAREAVERSPAGARVSARASNPGDFEPGKALLEGAGFQVHRHSYDMRIDLAESPPPAPEPSGIEIRPYRHPDEAKAAFRASRDGFKDHFGHVEEDFEKGFERFCHYHFEKEAFDPALWFLAVDGDEICGVCFCTRWDGPEKDAGYVESLAVRRPWRRRGIAHALLVRAFEEFRRRGRRSASLGVDAESLTGAVRLYEKAGMYVDRRFDAYELELRAGTELEMTEAD